MKMKLFGFSAFYLFFNYSKSCDN